MMQGPFPIAPCPQVRSSSSREPVSSPLAARAPLIGVAGSWLLPITSTGWAVTTLKGPWKASSLVMPGQFAHGLEIQVQRAPNHGWLFSKARAARHQAHGSRGLSVSAQATPTNGLVTEPKPVAE